jgi:hypothetical protein
MLGAVKSLLLLALLTLLLLTSCKSGEGSGGRRQPKKGPIPCPLKDC